MLKGRITAHQAHTRWYNGATLKGLRVLLMLLSHLLLHVGRVLRPRAPHAHELGLGHELHPRARHPHWHAALVIKTDMHAHAHAHKHVRARTHTHTHTHTHTQRSKLVSMRATTLSI